MRHFPLRCLALALTVGLVFKLTAVQDKQAAPGSAVQEVRVQNVGALGVVAGGTTVSSGAALETDLAGTSTITNEALTLNGSGIINGDTTAVGTTVLGTGALRNRQGTTTWSGTVTIATGNTSIDAAAGSLPDRSDG